MNMNEKKDIITNAVKSAGKITITRATKYIPGVANTIDGFREFKSLISESQSKLHELKLKEYLLGINECPDGITIESEDFSHIIRQMAKDDEVSKTKFYSNLTISLSKQKDTMGRDERAFYINTLGTLTRYEIEFARQFLIYSSFDLYGYKNREEQMSELTSGNDGILLKTLNKLIYSGLVFDIKSLKVPGLSGSAGVNYRKTEQLDKFIGYIYGNIFINPEAIHKKEKDTFDVVIIKDTIGTDTSFDKYIVNGLRNKGYDLSIGYVEYTNVNSINPASKVFVYKTKFTDYNDKHDNNKIRVNINRKIDAAIKANPEYNVVYYEKDNKVGNKNMNKALDEAIDKIIYAYKNNTKTPE